MHLFASSAKCRPCLHLDAQSILRLYVTLLPVMPSNQKRQLERLFLVQSGIAEARVVRAEIFWRQALAATHTFCYWIASELEMDTPEVGAVLSVDAEG